MEKKDKITSVEVKRKRFVEEYYKNGFNGAQAYKTIYNPKQMASAISGANRMLQNDDIQALMAQMEDDLVNQALVTREDIISSNIQIRDLAQAAKKYSDAIKANSEISRLCGFYEAQKVETSGTIKFDFGIELDNDNPIEEEDEQANNV